MQPRDWIMLSICIASALYYLVCFLLFSFLLCSQSNCYLCRDFVVAFAVFSAASYP